MTVDFVERKRPDFKRIEALLAQSDAANRWANKGPLYHVLADGLAQHLSLRGGLTCVPMANAGIALEAMARLLSQRAGRKMRWAGSAFSFRNLGRGYFHDMRLLDCGSDGLLDLQQSAFHAPNTIDGLVLTIPFGLETEVSRYQEFADRHGLALLIDNASGFQSNAPHMPWQAFSLHHTKPYGVGEGGFAVVPSDDAGPLYELIDYASDQDGSQHWFGNGKISDVSCAFVIDRLERANTWLSGYFEQRDRVTEIAKAFGATPLMDPPARLPMTSLPIVMPEPVSQEVVTSGRHMTMAKYYKPLRHLPDLDDLFAHLVNVPCHPDVSALTDDMIENEFARMLCDSARYDVATSSTAALSRRS